MGEHQIWQNIPGVSSQVPVGIPMCASRRIRELNTLSHQLSRRPIVSHPPNANAQQLVWKRTLDKHRPAIRGSHYDENRGSLVGAGSRWLACKPWLIGTATGWEPARI